MYIDTSICQWEQKSNGIGNNYNIISITATDSFIFASCGGLYRSSNNGDIWTGFGPWEVYDIAANETNIFATSGSAQGGCALQRSTNNGINWIGCLYFWWGGFFNLYVNGSFAVVRHSEMYYSTNNGRNWFSNSTPAVVYSFVKSGSIVFAGTLFHGVYLTTNYGISWIQTSLNNQTVNSLAISEIYIFAGTDSGVYRSSDMGTTWIQTALNNIKISRLAIIGSNIFAGTNPHQGVYLSTNNGDTWTQWNEGFQVIPTVWTLFIKNGYIFAGTQGQSIWRRPLSDIITGTQPVNNTDPEKYYLGQNYPNPFNSITKIQFKVTSSKFVKLNVFDLLGREVVTLVNENLQPGVYEISFDARLGGSSTDLPSGVYFFKLTTDKFTDTKKLILIK